MSIGIAKYPVGNTNEEVARMQVKSILDAIHKANGDVGLLVFDGDFGYFARRDFDGSALTRNEMLCQLLQKWKVTIVRTVQVFFSRTISNVCNSI